MPIAKVHRISAASPDDVSGIETAIAAGRINPKGVLAVLGKTEGNGLVNDYARGYAALALKLMFTRHLGVEPADKVCLVMSGGTEGGMSPHWTVFERADAAGLRPAMIGPGYFDGSGLTNAALRGATFYPAEGLNDRVDAALAATRRGHRLVYLYWGEIDKAGHVHGVGSPQWAHEIAVFDDALQKAVEPGTPTTAARLATVRAAAGTAVSPAAIAASGPPPGGSSRTTTTPSGTARGGPTTTVGAPAAASSEAREATPAPKEAEQPDGHQRAGVTAQPTLQAGEVVLAFSSPGMYRAHDTGEGPVTGIA